MVLTFELAALLGTAVAFLLLVRSSIRQREVTPGLFLTVGFASTFWMEPIFDWGLYARFDHRFVRSSAGIFGLTPGGLPLIAGPAYAVYFLAAASTAVLAARRVGPRLGFSPSTALLVSGYAVGFTWDLGVELLGTQTHMWQFSRVARGFVPFGGSAAQIPLGMPLGMGAAIMAATYLLGMPGGTFLPAELSRRFVRRHHGRGTTLVTSVAVFNVVMGIALVPYVVTRTLNYDTVRATGAASSHGSPIGTLTFLAWFAAALLLALWWSGRHADDPQRQQSCQPADRPADALIGQPRR